MDIEELIHSAGESRINRNEAIRLNHGILAVALSKSQGLV